MAEAPKPSADGSAAKIEQLDARLRAHELNTVQQVMSSKLQQLKSERRAEQPHRPSPPTRHSTCTIEAWWLSSERDDAAAAACQYGLRRLQQLKPWCRKAPSGLL